MKTLLVIFGITGDLSTRKLLPALSDIISDQPERELEILGVSRRDLDARQLVLDTTGNTMLADRTKSVTLDVATLAEYERLKDAVKQSGSDQTLIYLSVPPGAAAPSRIARE